MERFLNERQNSGEDALMDELKRMKDLVSSLPTLKEKTSSDEFVRACRLISDLSDELKSYERISFESIL